MESMWKALDLHGSQLAERGTGSGDQLGSPRRVCLGLDISWAWKESLVRDVGG